MAAVHAKNEKGAVACSQKSSSNKLAREAWDKLPEKSPKPTPENKDPDYQCGNCRRVFARKEGRERINFGTVSPGKKGSTSDAAVSYTPRYGQV